ncbi:MAG: hypothetical protein RL345_1414 [Chloroflexota bacterium]
MFASADKQATAVGMTVYTLTGSQINGTNREIIVMIEGIAWNQALKQQAEILQKQRLVLVDMDARSRMS